MKTKMAKTFSSKVIREWLHEYKSLPEAEMHTYASTIRANDELITSLYELLEDDELPQEVVDPVCHQLFDFYRSGRLELQRFTLELVPQLVLTYLTSVANNDKKKCGGIEACLLGIYNLEITDRDGNPRMSRFTIPSIACPSIYHEPPSLATLALTESALLCYHSDEHIVINVGPLPQVESTNAQNRLRVLTHVMSCYNRDVANLSPRSHQTLCKMCTRLSKMGFDQLGVGADDSDTDMNESFTSSSSSRGSTSTRPRGVRFQVERRVTLSSQFLVELLASVYFVMFNGHARLGTSAVEAIDERANYEMWADVLLVTNAIKNSLMYNPSGQPMDGPMGISIALSPTTSNPSFSKHAITNASFRAKKLPDDIDVPESPEGDTAPPNYDDIMEQDQQRAAKTDSDKSKSNMFAKPLKSIMKSGKDKIKKGTAKDVVDSGGSAGAGGSNVGRGGRKDSARVDDSHSPRQSAHMATSQSLNLAQTIVSNGGGGGGGGTNNQSDLDLDSISVSVVRSSSRTKVDQIELRSVAQQVGVDSHHPHQRSLSSLEPDVAHHRRTSSFPEGGFMGGAGVGAGVSKSEYGSVVGSGSEAMKPLLAGSGPHHAGGHGSASNVNGAPCESDEELESVGFTTAL